MREDACALAGALERADDLQQVCIVALSCGRSAERLKAVVWIVERIEAGIPPLIAERRIGDNKVERIGVLRSALFQAPGFLLFQVDGKASRREPYVPVLSSKRREGRLVAPERELIRTVGKNACYAADGRRLDFRGLQLRNRSGCSRRVCRPPGRNLTPERSGTPI
jgi:hypothetical protein